MNTSTAAFRGVPGYQADRCGGWKLPSELSTLRIHMIGIGGSGMSGLAAFLARRGARVTGVDGNMSIQLARLQAAGVDVTTDQDPAALPADAQLVVASAAVPADHPQVVAAHERGLTVLSYAELLGAVMGQHTGVAIAGTHGKSTTTAWLTFVLRGANCDPSFVVGAESGQLGGSSGAGGGDHFVAEACEYQRSFLNLRPTVAAVLNIEEDHLDYYRDLDDICGAFRDFAARVPEHGLLVVSGDDARCRALADAFPERVETFGEAGDCTWRAVDPVEVNGRYHFELLHNQVSRGRFQIGLAGRHNLLNALAVIAIAHRCGLSFDQIRALLPQYEGVKRRLELRAEVRGVVVVDDYAHHPTEIRMTLRAARQRFNPRRLWCIFQPHQHSRTRFLLEDFAQSFALADRVIVPHIYFVRDSQRDREAVCAADLVARIRASGGDAVHIAEFDDIVEHLAREVGRGEMVMTMGAGNIWKVADALVHRLGADLPG